MKNVYSKWQRLNLDPFVPVLSNGAYFRYCDSSMQVWKHKVKSDCYRVTVDQNVEDVLLDEVTFEEVVEFLEDEE